MIFLANLVSVAREKLERWFNYGIGWETYSREGYSGKILALYFIWYRTAIHFTRRIKLAYTGWDCRYLRHGEYLLRKYT